MTERTEDPEGQKTPVRAWGRYAGEILEVAIGELRDGLEAGVTP